MSKKMGITAMILGIASLVLGLNGSYTWGILAVAGLVCAIISFTYQKKAKAEGQEDGFTKAAKITSIIGLVFCIIGILWGLISTICITAKVPSFGVISVFPVTILRLCSVI